LYFATNAKVIKTAQNFIKNHGLRWLKWIIAIGFLMSFLFQWKDKNALFKQIPDLLSQVPVSIWLVLLLLMMLNWGLETVKWRILSHKIYPTSWMNQMKAVLAGLAISTLVPNRMAEYGGRIWFIPAKKRWQAVGRSMLGGVFQLGITVWLGIIGAVIVTENDAQPVDLLGWGLAISIAFVCFVLLIYFGFAWIKSTFQWKWLDYFHELKVKDLFLIFIASLGRYIVFSTQFFLVFNLFCPQQHVIDTLGALGAMFLAQSVIPIPAVLDWSARFELAKMFTGREAQAAAATASLVLWMINLMLPSFWGIILFILHKKTKNHDLE
jgi:hypothetical protein